jgi:signal transduction histidine kinase
MTRFFFTRPHLRVTRPHFRNIVAIAFVEGNMDHEFEADITTVARIEAVPTILEVVCSTTGMGFAAVARVTEDRWVACGVRDGIAFGLKPGGELKIETTFCREVRNHRKAVVIDHVAEDDAYREHPIPAQYGFQSYISVPIVLADGSFFGTLCAVDPRPARLKTPETIGMFKLFADLIAFHLDAAMQLEATRANLMTERETAELREQFIAVLGHDLRNPLTAIIGGAELVERTPLNDVAKQMIRVIRQGAARMASLIDDVLDLARGRLGGGLTLRINNEPLKPVIGQVVDELRASFQDRVIALEMDFDEPIVCDQARVAQLLSNLVGNALTYGAPDQPIQVRARTDAGMFELSVANAGDPIPPEAMVKLFLPFSRGSVRPSQQGLGLGLFIASEVAKAHGGTLDVQSSAEQTRFTFRMPLVHELMSEDATRSDG